MRCRLVQYRAVCLGVDIQIAQDFDGRDGREPLLRLTMAGPGTVASHALTGQLVVQ